MIKEPNQVTTQTGNQFERTMLMMEIDKRDLELSFMREQMNLYQSATRDMAEALKNISESMLRVVTYDERDWTEFKFILDKYGVSYTGADLSSFSLIIPEFVRWKLARHVDEKSE